jgi:hypothetical protein
MEFAAAGSRMQNTSNPTLTTYDNLVLSDSTVAYWSPDPTDRVDLTGGGRNLTAAGGVPGLASMPGGGNDTAAVLDGTDDYLQAADDDIFSVPATGILTVECWMRPDTLDYSHTESSSEGQYVNWLGKGTSSGSSGNQEWHFRMYNQTGSVRPNRISGYAFNPVGGLGAGSYFQDTVVAGDWIHVALTIDTINLGGDGWGTTKLYKNGVLRDTDSLGGSYNITPVNGNAPLRIGTTTGSSFFQGAVGKIAVYNYAVPATRLLAHYNEIVSG